MYLVVFCCNLVVVVVVVVGVCSGFMAVQWPTNIQLYNIQFLFNLIFYLMDVGWMLDGY